MSSYLIAAPEALATASADLSGIGEAIRRGYGGGCAVDDGDCARGR